MHLARDITTFTYKDTAHVMDPLRGDIMRTVLCSLRAHKFTKKKRHHGLTEHNIRILIKL